jgi:hypothetical protein
LIGIKQTDNDLEHWIDSERCINLYILYYQFEHLLGYSENTYKCTFIANLTNEYYKYFVERQVKTFWVNLILIVVSFGENGVLLGGGISPADWYIFSEQYLKKKCGNLFFNFLSSIKVYIIANVYIFIFQLNPTIDFF